MGLLVARNLATLHPGAIFVVDVKSTGLFATDPVLAANNATVDYWKTGHSHIKGRMRELGAIAGFERSGHFFFGPPIGRGTDDGIAAALSVLDLLDRHPERSLAELSDDLPRVWASPTMSAHCSDTAKYRVVEQATAALAAIRAGANRFAGEPIRDLVTVNGVRVIARDGTWGLLRASSNKPELVVVVESPVSESRMRDMFAAIDGLLRDEPGVGAYNQTL